MTVPTRTCPPWWTVGSRPSRSCYVSQEHDGFGAGRARNLGARSVDSDVIVFLDSDAIVGPDFVARHAKWHEDNPKAVVIGGRVHLSATGLDPDQLAASAVDLDSENFEDRSDFRTVLSRRTSNLQGNRRAVSCVRLLQRLDI